MTDIGRIFGNKVMELRFRTGEAEDLQVGEMLVVEEGGVKFLVRTMDVLFGADSDDDDYLECQAGVALKDGFDYERIKGDLYKVGGGSLRLSGSNVRGSSTFCAASVRASRLNVWKTKPISRLRIAASSSSSSFSTAGPLRR